MNGCMDGWTDERRDGRRDERMDGRMVAVARRCVSIPAGDMEERSADQGTNTSFMRHERINKKPFKAK